MHHQNNNGAQPWPMMTPYSSHWFLFSNSFALLKKYSLICASTKISWCACSVTASIDLFCGSLNRSSSSKSASFSSSIVFSATGSIGMIHSSTSSARLPLSISLPPPWSGATRHPSILLHHLHPHLPAKPPSSLQPLARYQHYG